MSNDTAKAIIKDGENAPRPINMTTEGGASKVYSQVPLPTSKELMGTRVSTVKPGGSVTAHVQPHGVAMFRLREIKSNDEL